MIAREWHGVTPAAKAEAYRQYMLDTAVKELHAVLGNRGVYFLRRIEGEVAHFRFITLRDSYEAIRRFAGEDYERAVYYPEDKEFLLELEPHVAHYEIFHP